MPRRISNIDVQWEADEDRPDMTQAVSEYLVGPGTIGHSESVTVTWSAQGSFTLDFDLVKSTFGGTYSESRTFTNTYTKPVDEGATERIVYIPRMHHINGWITITEGGDIIPTPVGPSIPTKVEIVVDHQWCPLYFPIQGGTFALERKGVGVVSHFGT